MSVVEFRDVVVTYDGYPALAGATATVESGQIVLVRGENGAGKSTTVKILTGMIHPDAGRAEVAGFDVVAQPMEVKKRIGYVPETAALYDGLKKSVDDLDALLTGDDPHAADQRRLVAEAEATLGLVLCVEALGQADEVVLGDVRGGRHAHVEVLARVTHLREHGALDVGDVEPGRFQLFGRLLLEIGDEGADPTQVHLGERHHVGQHPVLHRLLVTLRQVLPDDTAHGLQHFAALDGQFGELGVGGGHG